MKLKMKLNKFLVILNFEIDDVECNYHLIVKFFLIK